MTIRIKYSSIDRVRTTKKFKTLAMARRFAHRCVGEHPEIGSTYAVSGDGVGKIEVFGASGVTLRDIFPEKETQS